MPAEASWWLKVKRAQKHMVDIRSEARHYADRHPYEVVRVRQNKRNRNRWQYRLVFTEQPDPIITVMIGDFVHNLRSALDHVAVACTRRKFRKNASFPISFDPELWKMNAAKTDFVRPRDEGWESYLRAVRGMSPEARAVILRMQPFVNAWRNPAR